MFDKIVTVGAAGALALTGYVGGFFTGDTGADATGTIYHYVRSNADGSAPENVYVFRAADNKIEIYRAEDGCAEADFMTAWVDPRSGRAAMMTGGRLMPNARHENFVTVAFDRTSGTLRGEAALPGGMARGSTRIDETNWHLHNVDFSTLSLQTMAMDDPRTGFSFALPVMRLDGEEETISDLGRIDVEFVRAEDYQGTRALRFNATGAGLGDGEHPIWLDADSGHVIGVEWAAAPEPDMEGYSLRLIDSEQGDDLRWHALLASHFEGCSIA